MLGNVTAGLNLSRADSVGSTHLPGCLLTGLQLSPNASFASPCWRLFSKAAEDDWTAQGVSVVLSHPWVEISEGPLLCWPQNMPTHTWLSLHPLSTPYCPTPDWTS